MSGQWAWVAQADDDFSKDCSDRRCDDCHEPDCCCACHIDNPEAEYERYAVADPKGFPYEI